jgi:hypothetical protein
MHCSHGPRLSQWAAQDLANLRAKEILGADTVIGIRTAGSSSNATLGPKLLREFLWAYLLTDHFTERAVDLSARANMPKLNRVQLGGRGFARTPVSSLSIFGGRPTHPRAAGLLSFDYSYALSGWRVGYIVVNALGSVRFRQKRRWSAQSPPQSPAGGRHLARAVGQDQKACATHRQGPRGPLPRELRLHIRTAAVHVGRGGAPVPFALASGAR